MAASHLSVWLNPGHLPRTDLVQKLDLLGPGAEAWIMLNQPPGAKAADNSYPHQTFLHPGEKLFRATAELIAAGHPVRWVSWTWRSSRQEAKAAKYFADMGAFVREHAARLGVKELQLDAEGEWLKGSGDADDFVARYVRPALEDVGVPVGLAPFPSGVKARSMKPLLDFCLETGGEVALQNYSFLSEKPGFAWTKTRGVYPDRLATLGINNAITAGVPKDRIWSGLAFYGTPHPGYSPASAIAVAMRTSREAGVHRFGAWNFHGLFLGGPHAARRAAYLDQATTGGPVTPGGSQGASTAAASVAAPGGGSSSSSRVLLVGGALGASALAGGVYWYWDALARAFKRVVRRLF